MKLKGVMVYVFVLLFMLPFVSSNIVIEDNFDNSYSVGDAIELDFSIVSTTQVSGFVEAYIDCDDENILIDKRYIFLDDEIRNFTTEFLLESEGECQFEVVFLQNRELSEDFDISSKIEINYVINEKNFMPGDEIIINGTARKSNGDKYTGVLDFEIEDLVEKAYSVEDGDFLILYSVDEEAVPKNYNLIIKILEKNSLDEEINSGRVQEDISVKSKPTSISINATDSFSPPHNFSFEMKLLNQVGDEILNESIIAKILDFENNVLFEAEVNHENETVFEFLKNTEAGNIRLNAYYGSIFSSFAVYIDENREVEMEFFENSVKIANVGNVLYEGIVKLEFDNGTDIKEEFINVTIPLGEAYNYSLEYMGDYNITYGDNVFSGIRLTGAAILVDGELDIRSLIVVILFMLFLILIYFTLRKKNVKNFFKKNRKNDEPNLERKIAADISRRKMIIRESPKKENKLKQDVYMIFLKSKLGIAVYSEIISKYGFKINNVNPNLAYVVFYGNESLVLDNKVFNLSKVLRRFSDMKNDDLTIVLNKGFFEKKITLLKKFASINRELIDMFPEKTIIGNRLMKKLNLYVDKEEKTINILDYKLRVWIIK